MRCLAAGRPAHALCRRRAERAPAAHPCPLAAAGRRIVCRAAASAPEPGTEDEAAPAEAAASPTPTHASPPASTEAKSDEYSEDMSKAMGTTLTYRHEDGLNYNRILPDLIVGSCLQTPEDVDLLAERENVRTVFCLQEDPDMEYFSLDVKAIQARCEERGDIKHVRFPIRDFDPFDLRRKLPKAVSRLAREHDPDSGTIYIHCTAGLGRAPATALAYMFWLRGFELDAAYELLRGKRMCSPRIEAIRSATVDMLVGTEPVTATIELYRLGTATEFKVAGLDVGWHQQLPMTVDRAAGRAVLVRTLQPGKYPYKFVIDGNWTYSADHPTTQDGNNINNFLEVLGRSVPDHLAAAQLRLLAPKGDLTPSERAEMAALLCPWSTHDRVHGTGVHGNGAGDGNGAGGAPAWALGGDEQDWADKLP